MKEKMAWINERKNSTWLAIGMGLVFILLILFNQLSNNPTSYELKLRQIRSAKDLQFKNDPAGPIPKNERALFSHLKYFPADKAFLTEAQFLPAAQIDTLRLMTTTGQTQRMLLAGKVQFQLEEKLYRLTAYQYLAERTGNYFIPFTDETSGAETYGGGRYLDVPIEEPLIIDFNTAYNPYCVYNVDFSCPIPPRENFLNVAIKAGEMNYKP